MSEIVPTKFRKTFGDFPGVVLYDPYILVHLLLERRGFV